MADIHVLTTHVGSLPGPAAFETSDAQDEQALRGAVQWVVSQQRAAGLDIINEGELTKGGDWLSFADSRLGGFEERPFPASGSMLLRGKDRQQFADFYKYATERQTVLHPRRPHQAEAAVHRRHVAGVICRSAATDARDRDPAVSRG